MFSAFGDVQAVTMNFLSVPIQDFFAYSLYTNYDVKPNREKSEFFGQQIQNINLHILVIGLSKYIR